MSSELNKTCESGELAVVQSKAVKDSPSNLSSPNKLTKKESLKLQKQTYKLEKKKAENEYKMIAQDPAVVLLSDWLKVRNNLKKWSRMWCVLNPGMLIFYKNSKLKNWIGTVLLASVEIIERPSKKQGMCFKMYHILNQSVWASKGPKGENASILSNPLPGSYVILRAQTESDGQCWIDALELAKNCSNILKKSLNANVKRKSTVARDQNQEHGDILSKEQAFKPDSLSELMPLPDLADLQEKLSKISEMQSAGFSESKMSRNSFTTSSENGVSLIHNLKISNDVKRNSQDSSIITSSTESYDSEDAFSDDENELSSPNGKTPTKYVPDETEELGDSSENTQVEELEGENKSLVWTLLKQVKPGMDLAKVVLPTFILEPRSFLDKLSDYYFHADLLAKASLEKHAYSRMKMMVKWYLSGFYKKPKGLKKPYNPILGETFRCKWDHSDGSSTFYMAEQVSHHPPISALVAINRKGGFAVHGSILAKSKFYGNSLSAILDGNVTATLLNLGEEYTVTLPYAHCKGILYGKMTMEFGGKVKIKCEKTGYATEIEFKLKGLFGGSMNEITGRILLGNRVLATLSGCWDQAVHLTDLSKGTVEEFWCVTEELKSSRLQRLTVEPSVQDEFESANLWKNVTAAIKSKDQVEATAEKTKLEERQRQEAKIRKETNTNWTPKYFEYNVEKDNWEYKYMDTRPWDTLNDIEQFESKGIISTTTKHKTNAVRQRSSQRSKSRRQRSVASADQSIYGKNSQETSQRLNSKFQLDDVSAVISDNNLPLIQNQKALLRKVESLEENFGNLCSVQRRFFVGTIVFFLATSFVAIYLLVSASSSVELKRQDL